MRPKQPLGDDRLQVVEIVRCLPGQASEVEEALDGIDPGLIALDVVPDTLQQLVAHVKHGLGVEVPHLDEAWTNCLAAFGDVDPYGGYAAAVELAVDRKIPLVALDRSGKGIRKGQKRRLAKSLTRDPIQAEDVREIAMAFRGRLHELGLLDRIEADEQEMADTLWDVLQRGSRVAAVLSYPASEEIAVRLRSRAETAAEAETASR